MTDRLMRLNPAAALLGAVALVVAALAAVVVLYVTGATDGVTVVLGLVSPLVAALLVAAKVDAVTQAQNERLDAIHDNTNGKLTARVRAAVAEELAQLGLVPAQRGADELPAVTPESVG